MPKVSIIMPAYNCAGFIAQSIESATQQTEPDLEVVVMNDGSTDNTLEVVQALAEKDPRIKVLFTAEFRFARPGSKRGLGQGDRRIYYLSRWG